MELGRRSRRLHSLALSHRLGTADPSHRWGHPSHPDVTGPNRTDLRGLGYVPDVTGDPNPSQTRLNPSQTARIGGTSACRRRVSQTRAGRPAARVVLRVTSIVTGATPERFESSS